MKSDGRKAFCPLFLIASQNLADQAESLQEEEDSSAPEEEETDMTENNYSMVMLLARKEEKTAIMQAISKACGPQSEAHGLILSLPADGSAGL